MTIRKTLLPVLTLILLNAGGIARASAIPEQLPAHPRLLFTSNDLPSIRLRALGVASNHFAKLRSQADRWVDTKVSLPDRGGQWFHWYSCQKHGARLRNEGPTRHVCPVDHEILTGYPYDDVALSTVHSGLANAVRVLGMMHRISGEQEYAEKAKEILLAYARKYQSYPLHNTKGEAKVGGGKVGPQTLDESTWLIAMVEGADCIWHRLSDEERAIIERDLLRPATDVIRQHKMGIHNIQCWKNSAVGLTGLLLGDMAMVREAIDGESGYWNQVRKGVTRDGPWYEGAWGYHFYTINALLRLTEGAYNSGINLYGPELKKMFDAPLAMAMPNFVLPAFNDSNEVDLQGTSPAYETAFTRYKDEEYGVLAGKWNSDSALLHGTAPGAAPAARQFLSRNFAASGNVILANGSGRNATWLCMKYGPHGGGHGHPDKLNFVLYGLRNVIVSDPGTANYGVPIQAGWYRTTIAHNTLTVDEKSQQPAEGKCLAFISTNGFSAVSASAGNIYPGVNFARTVALIGGDVLLFVDHVASESEHLYDLALHCEVKMPPSEKTTIWRPSTNAGYSYIRDARAVSTSDGMTIAGMAPNSSGINLFYWCMAPGEPTKYIVGQGVGRHTEDRVPVLISRRKAKSTAYVWCMFLKYNKKTPHELTASVLDSAAASNEFKPVKVRLSHGGVTRVLISNPSGTAYGGAGPSAQAKLSFEEAGTPSRYATEGL